jgi:hypothetical protein
MTSGPHSINDNNIMVSRKSQLAILGLNSNSAKKIFRRTAICPQEAKKGRATLSAQQPIHEHNAKEQTKVESNQSRVPK